jgi:outer membrane protein
MNRTLKSILTLTAFGAAALGLSAQPALKLLTVDTTKLLEGFYKTEPEMAKLKGDQQKAQDELERKVKELNSLGDQYKELMEQSKSAMLKDEAKTKAEADAAKMLDEIRKRQGDIQKYQGDERNLITQKFNSMRGVLVDEILKKVTELSKSKGATIVIDRNAGVLFSDPAYDITEEALAYINKDRPASAAPATTSTEQAPAAAATAPSTSATPSVTVPGLAPKN